MTKGRAYDQALDSPRFKAAFSELCATRRSWPSPADLLEALPPREQLALTKQPIPADPDSPAMKARFAELAKVLGMPR